MHVRSKRASETCELSWAVNHHVNIQARGQLLFSLKDQRASIFSFAGPQSLTQRLNPFEVARTQSYAIKRAGLRSNKALFTETSSGPDLAQTSERNKTWSQIPAVPPTGCEAVGK